jgi:hypothetical protein
VSAWGHAVQTQTRRLERIALLASRQEAEFVSGVLDAADVPYAVVEVDSGLELRVDPDDAERVRELIERLDVKREAAEGTRQRKGEARGRWIMAWIGAVVLSAGMVWYAFKGGGLSAAGMWGLGVAVVIGLPVLAGALWLAMRIREWGRRGGK